MTSNKTKTNKLREKSLEELELEKYIIESQMKYTQNNIYLKKILLEQLKNIKGAVGFESFGGFGNGKNATQSFCINTKDYCGENTDVHITFTEIGDCGLNKLKDKSKILFNNRDDAKESENN